MSSVISFMWQGKPHRVNYDNVVTPAEAAKVSHFYTVMVAHHLSHNCPEELIDNLITSLKLEHMVTPC